MTVVSKVIVVEGKTDRSRLQEVLDEPVHIICTNGTMGIDKLDRLLEELEGQKVFIMTDADRAGDKIRSWFKHHLSESRHIYIDPQYSEVARCPHEYLAKVLHRFDFEVKDWNNEATRIFTYGTA